ncbi:hypothetical protein GQ600_377 [Phytophthora cactorum]|nr:hypothetical protein GQ600_377 [Phytophthora cactorum]
MDGHEAALVANMIEKRLTEVSGIVIMEIANWVMSDTAPAARAAAKHFPELDQEDCAMHMTNLCISYGLGVRDNTSTKTSYNLKTRSRQTITKTTTPSGDFEEGKEERGFSCAGFCLHRTSKPSRWRNIWLLQEMNPTWTKVKSFVIHKHFVEWSVLEECFPIADVLLCQFDAITYWKGCNDETTSKDASIDSDDDWLDVDSIGCSDDLGRMREMEKIERALDEEEVCTSQTETVTLLKAAMLSRGATLSSTLTQDSSVEPTQVTTDQQDCDYSAAGMPLTAFAPSTYAAYEETPLSQVLLGEINITEQS